MTRSWGGVVVGLLAGCGAPVPPEPLVLHGDGGGGYGIALAWQDGELWVGAPLRSSGGRVYRGTELVLSGEPGDFLGASLAGGGSLLVGAPRAGGGRGRILNASGATLAEGDLDEGLGARVTWSGGEPASITRREVRAGAGRWPLEERGRSLLSAMGPRGEQLVVGTVDGALWRDGEVLIAATQSDLGASLASCGEGGDARLYVGVPSQREIRIYSLDAVDGAPLAILRGPARSLACADRGLFSAGEGEVWGWKDPLRDGRGHRLAEGPPVTGFGEAMALDPATHRLAVGAPAGEQVWVFDAGVDAGASLR